MVLDIKFAGALRVLCFGIAYASFISSVVSIAIHLFTLAFITNGFRCEPDPEKCVSINSWTWLTVLQIQSLGVHGFYPFPQREIFDNIFLLNTSEVLRCYPNFMFYIRIIDATCFIANVIWLQFVYSFVAAVHKNNVANMKKFRAISAVKLLVQIAFGTLDTTVVRKVGNMTSTMHRPLAVAIVDICVSAAVLIIIEWSILALQYEDRSKTSVQPPSYVECLNVPCVEAPLKNKLNEHAAINVVGVIDEKAGNKN